MYIRYILLPVLAVLIAAAAGCGGSDRPASFILDADLRERNSRILHKNSEHEPALADDVEAVVRHVDDVHLRRFAANRFRCDFEKPRVRHQ